MILSPKFFEVKLHRTFRAVGLAEADYADHLLSTIATMELKTLSLAEYFPLVSGVI
jgi:hypothetical protein